MTTTTTEQNYDISDGILDRATQALFQRARRDGFVFDQPARDCCYWWGELLVLANNYRLLAIYHCDHKRDRLHWSMNYQMDSPDLTQNDRDGAGPLRSVLETAANQERCSTKALRQQIIIEILRNRLDELLPEPLSTVQERADQQRARLRAVFED